MPVYGDADLAVFFAAAYVRTMYETAAGEELQIVVRDAGAHRCPGGPPAWAKARDRADPEYEALFLAAADRDPTWR